MERAARALTSGAPEIQALRALAVLAVIVFHAWPDVLPGGYLGVDVFFVISGFLITAPLCASSRAAAAISLAAFWARRARRLLPAAFMTLIVCTVARSLIVPRPFWQPFLREIAASAMYVENWRLAADAIDYHAAERRRLAGQALLVAVRRGAVLRLLAAADARGGAGRARVPRARGSSPRRAVGGRSPPPR